VPDPASLQSIDQLILDAGGTGDVGKQSKGPNSLLLEHLRSARTSLLGSMLAEYRSSLQEAQEAAGYIADKSTKIDIRKRLQHLLAS